MAEAPRVHDAAAEAHETVEELQEQLSAMAGRLERVHACTAALRRSGAAARTDRGVQAELCGRGAAGCAGPAPPPLAPDACDAPSPFFEFRPPRRRINWRRIHSASVPALAAGGGGAILSCLEDTAFGDVDGDSYFNLSEGNLRQLLRLCQLQLQYMHWQMRAREAAHRALEDGAAALAAGLAGLQRPGLGDVAAGLADLRGGVARLGAGGVASIVERAREEERGAAAAALADALGAARARADARHGVGVAGGCAGVGAAAAAGS
ncbi:hypothetical protein Rsub_00278 [Raphidocelis subcapitata]|uniref:Cilium assembly protein DZIP1 N-terminal domain-containing protein n=1 Tax=Raphidocelis subcapitata TaxID=307507 RepID=A0A2V0NRL6_9CHLO|nr:hypothetical protein Rsub_00278 [Raphidocelis subcapitata]|eukprot:GBF87567.1 hypothetical protein Rsub_00278 [Raphidocelis subcapitata]